VNWERHLDEVYGAWTIVRFGGRYWAIDPNLGFHAMTDTQALAFLDDGRTDTGVVGMLGGPLDEHEEEGRANGQCAAERICGHIGIARWPAIVKMLDLVRAGDTAKVEDLLNLGFLLKWINRYREEPIPTETILATAFVLLDGLYAYFNGGKIREVPFESGVVEVPGHVCLVPPNGADVNHVIVRADAATDIVELAGLWVMESFGDLAWNIGDLQFHFMTEAEALAFLDNGRTDTVVLGMLGSLFDGRAKGVSSASLLAGHLKVGKRYAVQGVLKKVRKSAEAQENDRLDLGFLLKWVNNSYRTTPVPPEMIAKMVSRFLDGLHDYFDEERICDEYLEGHGVWLESGGFEVCLIESDLESIGRSARTHGAAITVIRRSNGQTMISADYQTGGAREVMPYIALQVCDAEVREAGGSAEEAYQTQVALCATGFVLAMNLPGLADRWYWHAEAAALYNGTATHPDVPPSRLSLQRLGELIQHALSNLPSQAGR
jgi:hypothetical protein